MIQFHKGLIELHTKDTSMILSYRRDGLLENLYYGARIELNGSDVLQRKVDAGFGCDVVCAKGHAALSSLCLELSPVQRGDYRKCGLIVEKASGEMTGQYTFSTATQMSRAPGEGMPYGRNPDEVLAVSFQEPAGLTVEIFYSVFYDSNVITKKMRVTNTSPDTVQLRRAMSNQLDLPGADYDIYTLNGAWAREFQLERRPLSKGTHSFGSCTGNSSNHCNPFFFLSQKDAAEDWGDVYGFNLIYSGSHYGSVEVDGFGKIRVLQGVQPEGFCWPLAPGERFLTPEAVLTFSDKGHCQMSHNMHHFIKNHIIPPAWREVPRPVLVNNWEGTYFDFNESKLLGMAKVAAKLGAELFVLDDGWFGRRDSDTAGLGDYDVNTKKLPSGLEGLARKLRKLGLDFGLWFEPEMVNADSRLYEEHPDWVVGTPGYRPCLGRNQYVLDLCRPQVRQYIVDSVGRILDRVDIRYVKWDMNRNISDAYSPALAHQGMFHHGYILGLYDILQRICTARPEILFEGCASGGNRFDLGILFYMPQIWVSDNTDALMRQKIQTGASYGYPQCTWGSHVSAAPNHQTLRKTPLETRFNTAAFGLLGYELDPRHLTGTQKEDIQKQIEFYKQYRQLLQFGDFYRLKSPFKDKDCRWMVVLENKQQAMVGDFKELVMPNSEGGPMKLKGLDPRGLYEIKVRRQKVSIDTFGGLVNYLLPVHLNPDGPLVKTANRVYRLDTEEESYTAYGSLLCRAGVQRKQEFSGSGYSEEMRLVSDFASRMYILQKAAQARPGSREL